MKDTKRKKRRKGPAKGVPKTSANRPRSSYTPEQREKYRKGIRILARMVVRKHMQRLESKDCPPMDNGSEEVN